MREVAVVATDVDGTLTHAGELRAAILAALDRLACIGVRVVPVSGRCSGEVLGLVRYLPGVRQGIAENGVVLLEPERPPLRLIADADPRALRRAGERLNREYAAGLELAPDEMFRLGDVAYERHGRDETELERLRVAAATIGVHLVWSSVHIHLSSAAPDKGRAVLDWAQRSGVAPARILTIGDAPNDVGLFAPERFGMTVGTADVAAQADHFAHLPEAVTGAREGDGFLELVRVLENIKR